MKNIIPIYTIGLDIGVSSIGWSVIENSDESQKHSPLRLIDFGVRLFDVPEVPKNGEALNKIRRAHRSLRKRLARRRWRLKYTKELLSDYELIPDSNELEKQNQIFNHPQHALWPMRANALNDVLEKSDLARIIFTLIKWRGAKLNQKNVSNDSKDAAKEQGWIASISNSRAEMQSLTSRTWGEYIYNVAKTNNAHSLRNKGGIFFRIAPRDLIRHELVSVLDFQSKHHKWLDQAFKDKALQLFDYQKPAGTKEDIEKMVGFCELEKTEKRAPVYSFTYEKFRILQGLANLVLYAKGNWHVSRMLKDEEKDKVLKELESKEEITYKQLRKLLNLPDDAEFKQIKLQNKEKAEEKSAFSRKKSNSFLKILIKHNDPKVDSFRKNTQLIDEVAEILTLCQSEEEAKKEILKHDELSGLLPQSIEDLVSLPCKNYCHLSLKAMTNLIPHLEAGLSYYDACAKSGYLEKSDTETRSDKLPLVDQSEIRNPRVLRAVTQSRKVVNAIIARYGAPLQIHVELLRELKQTFRERMERTKYMGSREQNNAAALTTLSESGAKSISGKMLIKFRLWEEQGHKCIYSGESIDISLLISDDSATQIDHIQPFSRSLDDSLSNKVLCLTSSNQNKRDQTPFEWLSGEKNAPLWLDFVARVNSTKSLGSVKSKKLLSDYLPSDTDEILKKFQERDLSESQYISKYVKNFLEKNLLFSDSSLIKKRVITTVGRVTALLRRMWGLSKNRDLNNRHHALDAVVIALGNESQVKKIAKYYQDRENGKSNKELSFPAPWLGIADFRNDILNRIFETDDPISKMVAQYYLGSLAKFSPLMVSRMPSRRISGQVHNETIVSDVPEKKGKLSEKNQKSESWVKLKNVRGKAANASIVRVDVFHENNKYYFVPIYLSDTTHKELPQKAIKSSHAMSDWPVMKDENFVFSLYKNDYLSVKTKTESIQGYFAGIDRSSAGISIRPHDRSGSDIRTGATNSLSISKYEVSLLGDLHQVKKEKRHGF